MASANILRQDHTCCVKEERVARVEGGGADQQGLVDGVWTLLLQSELEHHLNRRVTQYDFEFKRVIPAALWK